MHYRWSNRLIKQTIRRWLIKSPWLFEKVCLALGKQSQELMIMRRIVQRGDNVFDIGANLGQFTFHLGYMVGRNGSVHAFEPLPSTFRTLTKNALQNPIPGRLFLNNCALSDKPGTVTMFVPKGDITQAALAVHYVASWSPAKDKQEPEVHEGITASTLDEYIAQHGIANVSFIKCDVEGAELLVFRGAKRLLSQPWPPILFVEIYDPWMRDFGYQSRDLFDYLAKTGRYSFFHISENGLSPVDAWQESIPGSFPDYLNFLCVVAKVHDNRLSRLFQDFHVKLLS